VVASLATVIKDPVHHGKSAFFPCVGKPYSSVVAWCGWYEIVRYRELKVRCRTISVTASGTIPRVRSQDIFRKSYDI